MKEIETIYSVSATKDEKHFLIGAKSGISLFSCLTGRFLKHYQNIEGTIWKIATLWSGKIAAGNDYGTIFLVNLNGELLGRIETMSGAIFGISVTNDEKNCYIVNANKSIFQADLLTYQVLSSKEDTHEDRCGIGILTRDENLILTGSKDHKIKIWGANSQKNDEKRLEMIGKN